MKSSGYTETIGQKICENFQLHIRLFQEDIDQTRFKTTKEGIAKSSYLRSFVCLSVCMCVRSFAQNEKNVFFGPFPKSMTYKLLVFKFDQR